MNILTHLRSPNYEARKNGAVARLVILHYTGMVSGEAALARLTDPASKVSAHYVVEEDGRIFQLVDDAMRAWHAGASYWAGERDINSHSIGIEIVNPGHECGYRPFPHQQMKAVLDLCLVLKARYHLPAAAFLGHSDVAPLRKEDPGELFDWAFLACHGIGLWPDGAMEETPHLSIAEAQNLLSCVGYECPQTGQPDSETKAVIRAFQRHFRPRDCSGQFDGETAALLVALSKHLHASAKPAA